VPVRMTRETNMYAPTTYMISVSAEVLLSCLVGLIGHLDQLHHRPLGDTKRSLPRVRCASLLPLNICEGGGRQLLSLDSRHALGEPSAH
jgi:hypothetical protein